ncbi:MAG: hypothetical protein PWP23_3364, partial [Candidatus Sumerlaeota bacterium]|nr:hypothetical protein [Candidatus Sumerlaeota bacterium]
KTRPQYFLRRDLEHMTKDELLRSVVAELPRRVPQLRIEQGVEVSSVERRDHGITEIREEIAQVERELAASRSHDVTQSSHRTWVCSSTNSVACSCLSGG